MLENIKSIYFEKNLFSYLDDVRKLQLIRYNKYMQNKIDINLMNYRRISQKYIIFDKNNIVKEYNSCYDELIFEGEYLNGKRNGKGKEYYNNKLIFEGEYLNDKRNGKGKEYDNNKLIFEGEYLNGKKWNGKRFNEYNQIIYELKDGKGFISDYFRNNSGFGTIMIECEYINGENNGKTKEYLSDSLIFDGEYLNGKRNGNGKEYNDNGILIFEGEYFNGKKWKGKGKEYNYKGEFLNGEYWKGKGKEFFMNCYLVYEGEYMNGEKNGKGKTFWKGEIVFEGEFLDGQEWNGKKYDKNGNIEYELKIGKGYVKEYDYNENLIFEEEYLKGKRYAKGKEYKNNKVIYEGEFSYGSRNGNGKEYDEKGNLIFEGEYYNGEKKI